MAKTYSIRLLLFFSLFLVILVGCSPEDGIDGTNGKDGLNSLIKTMVVQPGSDCTNGGFMIQSGLDSNANGTLDPNEIDNSEYLCNGSNSNVPYVSYVSLISQVDEDNPTSIVLENTLNLSISWVRQSQGKYLGTLDEPITVGKTAIFYSTPTTHTGVRGEIIGDNKVLLELQNGTNAFMDNFSNLSFELRQYE